MVMGIQHWSVIAAELLVTVNIVYLKMVKDGHCSRTAAMKTMTLEEFLISGVRLSHFECGCECHTKDLLGISSVC